MAISKCEVLRIAELARLHFEEDDLETFTAQFQHILDYIETLKEVAVDGVAPTSHLPLSTHAGITDLRTDELCPSLREEEALLNAPDKAEGHFLVPRVL